MMTTKTYQHFFHLTYMLLAYAFVYLPIIVLAYFSFKNQPSSVNECQYTLKWYWSVLESKEVVSALATSLLIATVATMLSITMGLGLAAASHWLNFSGLIVPFFLNMMIPEIMIGVGVSIFFVVAHLPTGWTSLIAGHTVLGLGITAPLLQSAISELDPEILEASCDLGANDIQTFWKIIVPMIKPVIISSIFLVFTISLDDFFVSLFCTGPGLDTISTLVYAKIRTAVDPSLNALSVIVVSISLALAAMLYLISHNQSLEKNEVNEEL